MQRMDVSSGFQFHFEYKVLVHFIRIRIIKDYSIINHVYNWILILYVKSQFSCNMAKGNILRLSRVTHSNNHGIFTSLKLYCACFACRNHQRVVLKINISYNQWMFTILTWIYNLNSIIGLCYSIHIYS